MDNSETKIFSGNDKLPLLVGSEGSEHRRLQAVRKCYKRCLNPMMMRLFGELWGEFVGTFLMVLVTLTINATDVLLHAEVGLWQVSVATGMGVTLGIYATCTFSNSHFNPAVTLAFAIARWKVFSWKKIVPYILVQVFAGFLAATVVYGLFWNAIEGFEKNNSITRGSNNSVLSATIFGESFPNPNFNAFPEEPSISPAGAFGMEVWATGLLVFFIFSFADPNNSSVGNKDNKADIVPLLVGLTVALLTSLFSPLTQAGMNPARDFGPRLFAAAAGWGRIAIPGPKNGFWVYIVGPLIGGPIGGLIYDNLVIKFIMMKPEGVEH